MFLLSAPAAYAHPSFELTESTARAGDHVGFCISGADGSATYALEVDHNQVLEGAGGGAISGVFTVPDLGDAVRTVTVEAEIRASDKQKRIKRKLEYLGSALPLAGPPASASPPAIAAVVPAVAPAPEPNYSPNPISGTSSGPAVTPPPRRQPRQSRKARAVELPLHVARSGERRRRAHRGHDRRNRDAAARNARPRRLDPRTAPLFGSIPPPGARARPGAGGGIFSLNAIAPPAAVLAATRARPGDDRLQAAVVVPALLGLAGLALTGTAVLRRRRLASRPGRD